MIFEDIDDYLFDMQAGK